MSFVAVTLPTVIGVGGALLQANAAGDASDALLAGADAATREDRRQYDQTRADYAPWREAGTDAVNRLGRASTGDMSDFQASPGYNFRVSEGNRNMENRFSVGGGGGNAMRALAEYNQNIASDEYGDWWNRQAGLSGVGQTATAGTAAAGDRASARIGSNYLDAGNARASGIMGQGQIWNNALQGIGSNLSDALRRKQLEEQQAGMWGPPGRDPNEF